MRTFVVIGHEAHTAPDFSLDDLPGTSGRIDILARCAAAALLVSHGIRKDVEAHLVLNGPPQPPRTIRMVGGELRHLNPDERTTASLFLRALRIPGIMESMSTPGVYVSGLGLSQLVARLKGDSILLKEDGEDIRGRSLPRNPVFFLSDHMDFTEEEEKLIMSGDPIVASLGPRSLQANHCISIANNELDRRESSW